MPFIPRVTDAQVKAILPTSVDTSPYIKTANTILETQLAGQEVAEAVLIELELWLTAHLVALRGSGQARRTSYAGATIEYDTGTGGHTGLGLDATRYGQTVKMLDPTGILGGTHQQRAWLAVG
jgi:hypothetical protein